LLRHPRLTLFPYTTLFRSLPSANGTWVERASSRWSTASTCITPARPTPSHHSGRAAKASMILRLLLSGSLRPTRISPSSFILLRSEEHTSELQSRGHLVCR